MASDERLRELEEKYEGYTVYDNVGEKIGKVDELFVDEDDREEYIGVKMGLFGLSGTTLVPMEISRVDEQGRRIEVAETKEHVKDAPTYNDDDEVDSGFEDRIRRHFGLESSTGQSSYGWASGAAVGGAAAGARTGAEDDVSSGDRAMQERHSDVSTGERGRAEEDDVAGMSRGHREGGGREGGDREDLGVSGSTTEAGSAGGAMIQHGGEPGGEGSGERSGTQNSADPSGASTEDRDDEARSGGAGEAQTGDLRSAEDERVREAVREGVREGIREGLRESGGRGESGDRGDSDASGSTPGSGSAGEAMIQHGGAPGGEGDLGERGESSTGSREETRDAQQSSSEGEQEEGSISKVWRRVSR